MPMSYFENIGLPGGVTPTDDQDYIKLLAEQMKTALETAPLLAPIPPATEVTAEQRKAFLGNINKEFDTILGNAFSDAGPPPTEQDVSKRADLILAVLQELKHGDLGDLGVKPPVRTPVPPATTPDVSNEEIMGMLEEFSGKKEKEAQGMAKKHPLTPDDFADSLAFQVESSAARVAAETDPDKQEKLKQEELEQIKRRIQMQFEGLPPDAKVFPWLQEVKNEFEARKDATTDPVQENMFKELEDGTQRGLDDMKKKGLAEVTFGEAAKNTLLSNVEFWTRPIHNVLEGAGGMANYGVGIAVVAGVATGGTGLLVAGLACLAVKGLQYLNRGLEDQCSKLAKEQFGYEQGRDGEGRSLDKYFSPGSNKNVEKKDVAGYNLAL